MGAKPSKSSDDPSTHNRSFINKKKKNNNHNFRAVLTPTNNNNIKKKKDTVISTTTTTQTPPQTTQITPTTTTTTTTNLLSTPSSSRTTEHDELPKKEIITAEVTTTNNTPQKRSSPGPSTNTNIHYDPLKSSSFKKSRNSRKNTPSNASKHISIISNTSTTTNENKSSMSSSGWTTLSNDPFSQIEAANTSAFTEITDQSTISRKSLYPVLESSISLLPTTNNSRHSIHPFTTQSILSQLNNNTKDTSIIIKEAYKKAQQQNDPYDWHQFYSAMEQFYSTHQTSDICLVYLAKCLIAGLGVSPNIVRGLELLKSNPTCETTYALGHCYLDGLPQGLLDHNNNNNNKKAAYDCFQYVIQHYTSPISIIAEAQCTLARMLFQGDGVQQDTRAALNYLMKSAENNNMYAQFLIGVHYERGFDLPQDLIKAKDYYGKSADGGFPDAQAALGSRLIVEHRYQKGIEWLEKAVQMGNSRAHVQLGILYDKGQGVEQNNDLALLHYKAAVENNNPAAKYILGLVYYFGRLGRQKNHKEAIRLIKQSAMAGLPYAQRVLGQLYQQGSINQENTTTTTTLAESRLRTKKNEREAIRWYKRAATGKDVSAMGILGKCYELGTGVEVDFEKALAFYAKAAEQPSPFVSHAQIDQALLLQKMARHAEAFRLYSIVLEEGQDPQSVQTAQVAVARYHLCHDIEGVIYDPIKAHTMLLSVVETTNDPHAHYWLGSIYDEGIPGLFDIDRQKAFQHFLVSANAGDVDATFLVAYMMSNHIIPLKGPADAFPWYQKAAAKGHRTAMYSLGMCYYKAVGIPESQLDLALEWFEKSARLGVTAAYSYVGRIYLQLMVSANHHHQPTLAQQHFVKAVHWLKKGAEHHDTYSQRELGKIYLTGKGLPIDHALAFDLLAKATTKNDPEATTFLGDCYHKGHGVEKNTELAIEHYLRAATLGYPFAYCAAAELYYELGNMEYAYNYYLLASKEPKILNSKIGKTARMMVARLALGYIPLMQTNPALLQPLFQSNKTISPEACFEILSQLSIHDQFPQAFQPLGLCYLNGTGIDQNPLQAIFWLRKAAQELNDPIAYFNLADVYINGAHQGIPSDIQLGLSYLRQSAEMGYTEAQYRMGRIHLQGEFGQAIDERSAAQWFKSAANQLHVESIWSLAQMAGHIQQLELQLQYQKKAASLGHILSMRVLGTWYLKQLVESAFLNALVQQEYLAEALKYLHMAGDAGDTASLVMLGKAYTSCIKTKVKFSASSSPTKEQLHHLPTPSDTHSSFDEHEDEEDEGESRFQCEEDEKNLAIECFERASALGDIEATVYAAEAWHEQKQYAAALEYFEKAADQGNVMARFFCARYCIEGYGGSQLNPEKGFQELLFFANELNCIHAYNTLGQCYENGIGTTKNDQLAYQWYCRAAEVTHDAEAFYRIGQMYAQERIPTKHHKDLEACKIYDLAVNATPDNHGLACYQLGLYYLKGIQDINDENNTFLLPPDVCLSIEYFRTAADLNVKEAMYQLGTLFLNDDYSLDEQEEGLSRLQRASELGLREAQFELGLFYHRGKEFIMNSEEQVEEEEEEECILIPQDFEKAYDLFCRSAVQKHPTATYYLGMYHQHGIFVAPDLAVALEQYELAVELFEQYEHAPDRWQAEFNLARILHQDIESRVHAYELFQAAHLHAPTPYKFLSEIMIARYHLHGWADVPIQAEEAATTLIRFAQEEEKFGYRVYLEVAQCFEQGLGVPQDLRQAFHWYGEVVSKAHLISASDNTSAYDVAILDEEEIEEDEASAMFKLAEFYRKGLVVSQNIQKADDLYHLAARKGSQAAQEYLSYMLQKTSLYD